MHMRMPTEAELPALQEIERSAGECFREIGMSEIAEDEPPSLNQLQTHLTKGQIWVATNESDQPVAYSITEEVDGNIHLEQISVHAQHSRQGIGRNLIEYIAKQAIDHGLTALTLTTFTNIPWNAPYYQRCGFRILDDNELTPGLVAIRRREAKLGLDRWPRVCMRRDLT